MVTSEKTANEIYDVLATHITRKQMQAILTDLLKVKGNASFTETVERLMAIDILRQGRITP
jgi:hypothetical protein